VKDISNWLDALIISGLLFLLGSAIFILAFVTLPPKNEDLFSALVGGVIGASLMAYVNNRWGSSRGSAAKDETISTLVAQTPPAPTVTVQATEPLPQPQPEPKP
jgi:hypothetical protein